MFSALRLLAIAALALGCSGSPGAAKPPEPARWLVMRSEDGGFQISMPTAPKEKRASEGPVEMHLYASVDEDGTVYEVAFFDIPEALTPEQRQRLLDRVEAGLTGAPGARLSGARDVPTGGIGGRELRIDLGEGRAGAWRVLYVGDRRMFQISAVGPAPGLPAGSTRFFDSFRLSPRP